MSIPNRPEIQPAPALHTWKKLKLRHGLCQAHGSVCEGDRQCLIPTLKTSNERMNPSRNQEPFWTEVLQYSQMATGFYP